MVWVSKGLFLLRRLVRVCDGGSGNKVRGRKERSMKGSEQNE